VFTPSVTEIKHEYSNERDTLEEPDKEEKATQEATSCENHIRWSDYLADEHQKTVCDTTEVPGSAAHLEHNDDSVYRNKNANDSSQAAQNAHPGYTEQSHGKSLPSRASDSILTVITGRDTEP
jgi:hypothetical protein